MNKDQTKYSDWQDINWKSVEKSVLKLQKRIYRAKKDGNQKLVKQLQRLLTNSYSAKVLAIRKVTQDNRGKKTAGVDGKITLTPTQRIRLLKELILTEKAQPLRRIYIPKNNGETRPLSIPTIRDRAKQMLLNLALEPEWEAVFEPNSYGFRKGRSCHDAITAIWGTLGQKPKWILDADIAKCFDKINHNYLLGKLGDTLIRFKRQIKAWLKSGYMEGNRLFPTNEGTPQGGIISPLLANITLHGMEERLNEWVTTWKGQKRVNLQSFSFVRYADDFVCLHESEEVIQQAKEIIQSFLKPIGLIIKEEKTKIIHSFDGFDFLGFNIRQYKSGKHNSGKSSNGKPLGFKTLVKPSKKAIKKHYDFIANLIREKKAVSQDTLIHLLNPKIRGWANYYKAVCSKEIFSKLDSLIFTILHKWTLRRHPNKGKKWVKNKYWKSAIYIQNGVIHSRNWMFTTDNGNELRLHSNEAIQRHIKVKGDKSPYDGDYIYWGKRLSKSIKLSTKQQKLLKKQKGLCPECNRQFITGDIMEIDHIIPKSIGGKETYQNLQLIHAHCHDRKTRTDGSLNQGTQDKSQIIEEPCEGKLSSTVLKTSQRGDSLA